MLKKNQKEFAIRKTLFFGVLCSFFISFHSNAEFKKYKSKTQYNLKDNAGTNKLLEKRKDENNKDFYGREKVDISSLPSADKDKYVNLNPETAFGPEVITNFDFNDTSIEDLTKHMQKLTGINLIIDKNLKGKISISAPTPITVGDAWKAYLTALNLNDLTLVKSGNFYRIISARDVRYTSTKIYTGNYTPDTENYVMRIIPLKNIDSSEVTRSFRPFLSRFARIIPLKQTNTIIVQDTGANINRLTKLISFLDTPGHEESLQIIKIKNTSAQEVAKLLEQIIAESGAPNSKKFSSGQTFKNSKIGKIIPEPRTNSIIAMANKDGAKELKSLIKKLDIRLTSTSTGLIHVYYLSYAEAKKIQKILDQILKNMESSSSASKSKKALFTPESAPSTLFTSEVKVSADKDNNALVITATPTDYQTVKNVIKKLDIPRDQVYVEAMIMETAISRSKDIGINVVGAYGNGNFQKAGFVSDAAAGVLKGLMGQDYLSLGNFFAGTAIGESKEFKMANGSVINMSPINAVISAIASDSNTNVLANPQILAVDNEEATFKVGYKIPVITQQNTTTGTNVTSDYKDVALSLKIKPQINKASRIIKLKIDQEISDFAKVKLPSAVESQGIALSTRTTQTTVLVRDQDTVAMGGLMRDKITESENKVPILGDIPILGWLFKTSEKSVEKVNLLFFLTPKILDSKGLETAQHGKELLNRRNVHLKNVLGEDDSFKTTVKGMYNKMSKQEKGPLFTKEQAERYTQLNQYKSDENETEKAETEDVQIQEDSKELLIPDEPSLEDVEIDEETSLVPNNDKNKKS